MSAQQNSSAASTDVDKGSLWGWWYDAKKWQNDLHKKAAHKALDIPEDEMGVNSTKTTNVSSGLGWKELAVLGALGLGGYYVATQPGEVPQPIPVVEPSDSAYEVRFFNHKGELIEVPRHTPEGP